MQIGLSIFEIRAQLRFPGSFTRAQSEVNTMRSLWAIGLALLAGSAQAALTDVTLDNGMRVIVHEDRRAPVMVSQVWYRAGSMDEFNGTSGVAHVLEHMMFKGTETGPPGEVSKRIAAAGGRENAFTSRDYPAYFQQMQKDRVGLSMQLGGRPTAT